MTGGPTGTVSFVFTDIEGSTRLWQGHPAAMGRALGRHHAILRRAIESNGGYVFQIIGDAFCAAFATAGNALHATIGAQRSLLAEPWTETGPIRVRMAIHTGPAEIDPNDQVSGQYASGLTLSRAARLLSAGHGGQILMGATTYELVRDQLPEGVVLHDLGLHRLKDLNLPEHIFQVVASGLPAEFPPLRTLDAQRNNLPIQSTPFVGRSKELADCLALLRKPDVRLLTLTGPGGAGKTRLALQIAAELSDELERGVYFVDLSPLRQAELVTPAIAVALGVQPAEKLTLLDALLDYLRQKQMLLLLDNFEQVVEAAPLLAQMLQTAPDLKLLVTSRAALRLSAEHEYELPPLQTPDTRHLPGVTELLQCESVRLFVDRALAVKPDFQITTANAAAVAEICTRLDGLPLAIELAAARSNILTPQAMLPRLASRLSLLTTGARDLPLRHRTLRAAIDWSFALLTPEQQRLFRRLAVFSGGWTLEAAEALCGEDSNVLDGLAALVDNSLLHGHGETDSGLRFTMLETVREFAVEKLAENNEAQSMRAAHAHFFLGMAEDAEQKLHGLDQKRWLDVIEAEHDNMRAALQWAVERGEAESGLRLATALEPFWLRRNHWGEAAAWFDALLALPAAQSQTIVRARALSSAAEAATCNLNVEHAGRLAEDGISLCRELGDRRALARCLFVYAEAGVLPIDRQRTLLTESLSLFRETGDTWATIRPLEALADIIHLQDGDMAGSRALYEQALAQARASGDKRQIALVLCRLHDTTPFDDSKAPLPILEEAMALSRELNDRTALCEVLVQLALYGSPANAIRRMQESLAIAQDLGHRQRTAVLLTWLGEAYSWNEEYEEAERYMAQGLALSQEIGYDFGTVVGLAELGTIALLRGKYDASLALLRQSLAISMQGHAGTIWILLYTAAALAAHAAAAGEWQHAAHLVGAADAFLASWGRMPNRNAHALLERARASVQDHLGGEAFQRAWADGHGMTIDQAVEEALQGSHQLAAE